MKINHKRIAELEKQYWRSSIIERECMKMLQLSDFFDWELLLWKLSKDEDGFGWALVAVVVITALGIVPIYLLLAYASFATLFLN